MWTLILSVLRPIAWLLVILGVLFALLQAYLLGIPMLLAGLAYLWFTRKQYATTLKMNKLAHEGPSVTESDDDILRGKNNPFSRWFIADDADGANPYYRIDDHVDRNLDSFDR